MKYDVISKEEAEKKGYAPWPSGEYDFTILENVAFGTKTYKTEQALSKVKPDGSGGKPMWVIVCKIFAKDGSDFTSHIIDYIPIVGEMRFKHRHLAEALGLVDKYEAGTLTISDILHKSGKCKLGIQKGSQKQDGTFYSDKNNIVDYIPKDAPVTVDKDLDDTIPF